MAQRSRATYPRSPHSLTSECGWVTTTLTQPLRGALSIRPNGLVLGSWHSTKELLNSMYVHG